MEKLASRVHKLALPLFVKRSGSALLISDGTFKHEFDFKDFGQLTVRGIDSDGFVAFEISKAGHQATMELVSQAPLIASLEFTLVGSGRSRTTGYGGHIGTYKYFKRSSDEYYYAQQEYRGKTKKLQLGSLQVHTSKIHKIASACKRFHNVSWFGRKQLLEHLTSTQRHGQYLKSALDILTIEGYLEKKESTKRGRPHEQYKTTPKISEIK